MVYFEDHMKRKETVDKIHKMLILKQVAQLDSFFFSGATAPSRPGPPHY